jgi:hypothetical protein
MKSPREELWAIACGLSPRHQSQLKLVARQARRTGAWSRPLPARRWWHFEPDYLHPVEIPAARRLVFTTWRLWPLARTVHDTALLALVIWLGARFMALPGAAGAGWLSAGLLLSALAVMGQRVGAALRLMVR